MASRDYYEVLGVPRSASVEEIRRAYRKLALELHPDRNKSADAPARFQEVQDAYETLSDATRRAEYDRHGRAGPPGGARWGRAGARSAAHAAPDLDFDDLGSMFDAFFGGRRAGGFHRPGPEPRRGRAAAADVHHEIHVPFMTAVHGGVENLRVSQDGSARSIEVRIPPGVRDGGRLRVRGGAGAGHIILTVRVGDHPLYRRGDGLDLWLELPVTIAEAVMGAQVAVPTPDGPVELRIPPGTSSLTRLRLRGRGIGDAKGGRGDLYAVVKIVVPDGQTLSAQDRERLAMLSSRGPRPRAGDPWPAEGPDRARTAG